MSRTVSVLLNPISRREKEYEAIEKRLKEYFRKELYLPMLADLSVSRVALRNTAHPDALMDALFRGTVTYNDGVFSGAFNAGISKRLRQLGAKFDKRSSTYRLPLSEVPLEFKNVIASGESKFQEKIDRITKKLSEIVPEEFAKKFECGDLFDRTIWKANEDFRKNVKSIAFQPQFTEYQRKTIADEWQTNMELWIQNWTEEEIISLRKKMQETVFEGNRFGVAIDIIQHSYGVSASKAKFLARQETHLLVAKLNKSQYLEAGIPDYKWGCVHQPHDKTPNQHVPGNVRYYHGLLEGKIFRWDNPPITDSRGSRNNPGEDYNCRCYARPVVKFRKEK